ncbi:MAG: SMC-Scp complex subunit ScpB [Oscillospiraceae bacterium]|nr:SMC-Scp complex subunit ScpB [Oscillospiraceae bacterium]
MRATVEAMLFACGDAVSVERLSQALSVEEKTVDGVCRDLMNMYDDSGSAIEIVRLDGKYQMCTRSQFAGKIRELLDLRKNTPLSPAAMEVLAVIAYNEPVTRNFVERVRGVDCTGIVSGLVAKGLVEEAGRLEAPGRPMLYRTSDLFLRCFELESLGQLPPIPGRTEEGDVHGQIKLEEAIAAISGAGAGAGAREDSTVDVGTADDNSADEAYLEE